MVIINFVKLLYIDNCVGSIKEGKDVDLVFWIDYLLFVYVKVEKILIEGIVYFDLEIDKVKWSIIDVERNKFIKMMFLEKDGNGGKKWLFMKKDKIDFECEIIN